MEYKKSDKETILNDNNDKNNLLKQGCLFIDLLIKVDILKIVKSGVKQINNKICMLISLEMNSRNKVIKNEKSISL